MVESGNMYCRFNRYIVLVLLFLVLGCKSQETAIVANISHGAIVNPTQAVVLLKDNKPEEEPFCLDAVGSDGKKLTVGRLSQPQAKREAGRFYFGVFISGTAVTGERNLTLNRTFFVDPAGAVQAATQMGVSQFQVCPRFAGL
jgi:hypothetical protein